MAAKGAATKKTTGTASPRGGAGRPSLPPVTVARLEQVGHLIERIVKINQGLFIDKGQEYREAHRAGSSRPLTALESAQIAAVLSEPDAVAQAERVQDSTLRAYDEPDTREILFAAGIAVAPAFLEAAREVVALVEMPPAMFEQASEDGTIAEEITRQADALSSLEVGEAKRRASDAFAHYANAAGFEPGEALRLPVQAIWQALVGAVTHLADGSPSSQLIGSAESTEDSPAATSSTDSAGPTPSN